MCNESYSRQEEIQNFEDRKGREAAAREAARAPVADLDQLDALARAVIDADAAYNALDGNASCYFHVQAMGAARIAYSAVTPAVVLALLSRVRVAEQDTKRLDFLESRTQERERIDINYTDAWTESGDYGSVLSSGPAEFWLTDDGTESGPTLRKAIDRAIPSPTGSERCPDDPPCDECLERQLPPPRVSGSER